MYGRIEEYRNMILATADISEAELSPEISKLVDMLARANHEGWLKGKLAKGYVYGDKVNDDPAKGPLTSPLIVPYDELDEETKQSNIANVLAIVQILDHKGVIFANFTQMILYPMAKAIHDSWSRTKFLQGWKWGPVTDKANKIHRDLRAFEELASDPELVGDIAYDVDTARQALIQMISNGDIYPIITSLEAFKLG